MATVRIANAPVSFGVFELTAWRPDLPPAEELMAFVVAGGYEGVDLGPIGYLGERSDIAGRLAGHGLGLCGGWVEIDCPTMPRSKRISWSSTRRWTSSPQLPA